MYVWQDANGASRSAADLEKQFNDDTNGGKNAGVQSTDVKEVKDGVTTYKTPYVDGYTAIDFSKTSSVQKNKEGWIFRHNTLLKTNPDDGTQLYTPRPKVDNDVIGSVGYEDDFGATIAAATQHTDTNCYGFGLIVGANGWSHQCRAETQIIYSNLDLKITQTKKLSEVVTEPSWGNGKAKFIANLSDDAVSDFADPVLNSAIQWRLNNDRAKYVGWGFVQNEAKSVDFLKNMSKANNMTEAEITALRAEITAKTENAGKTDDEITELVNAAVAAENSKRATQALDSVGMYEQSDYKTLAAKQNKTEALKMNYTINIDDVAEYITKQYFAAFGFDPYSDASIEEQMQPGGQLVKGQVYDKEDVDNINFDVSPSEYKKSSANPDYPAGRWYMVHDTVGYTDSSGALTKTDPNTSLTVTAADRDPRSDASSDALETNITLPGRYSYFFAPQKTQAGDVDTSALTTDKAVFSFVVNQTPVARFEATIEDREFPIAGDDEDATSDEPSSSSSSESSTTSSTTEETTSSETSSESEGSSGGTTPQTETRRVISIREYSNDPDVSYNTSLKGENAITGARKYQVKVSDVNGASPSLGRTIEGVNNGTDANIVLNGIVKWEWRYEVLVPASEVEVTSDTAYSNAPLGEKYTVTTGTGENAVTKNMIKRIDANGSELLTIISSDWKANESKDWVNPASDDNTKINSPDGKTLMQLAEDLGSAKETVAKWYLAHPCTVSGVGASKTVTNAAAITSFNELPKSAIVNVYLRVTDTSTYLNANGKYEVAPGAGKVSAVSQVNVAAAEKASGKVATNPAASSMALDKLSLYDTAGDSQQATNKTIEVKRTSTHSQPGVPYTLIWKIGRGGSKDYRQLTLGGDGNYYWTWQDSDVTKTSGTVTKSLFHQWTWDDGDVHKVGHFTTALADAQMSGANMIPVLIQKAAPEPTEKADGSQATVQINETGAAVSQDASTGGTWTISHIFLNEYLKDYKDATTGMTLQINEVVYGYTTEDLATNYNNAREKPITDSSARTIFLKTDKNAPTAQVVTSWQKVPTQGNQNPNWEEYKASQYLDVTDGNSFIKVVMKGSADMEGIAKGYGYYFYGRDNAGRENAWYKLVPDSGSDLTYGTYSDSNNFTNKNYANYKLEQVYPENVVHTLAFGNSETSQFTDDRKYYPNVTSNGEDKTTVTDSKVNLYTVDSNFANGDEVSEIDYLIRVRLWNDLLASNRNSAETQYKSKNTTVVEADMTKWVNEIVHDKYVEELKKISAVDGNGKRLINDPEKLRDQKILVGEKLAAEGSVQLVFNESQKAATANHEFSLIFGRNAMIGNLPTCRLNLAIFAYDSQNSRDDTATGANESTRTRIEDIKLSISNPLPPELSAKDESNNTIAAISNIGGYLYGFTDNEDKMATLRDTLGETDYAAFTKILNKEPYRTDEMVTNYTYGGYSSSNVTVSFTPKQNQYTKSGDGSDVTYIRQTASDSQSYYEDIYGAADLTGSAAVKYIGYYWPSDAKSPHALTADERQFLNHPAVTPTDKTKLQGILNKSVKKDVNANVTNGTTLEGLGWSDDPSNDEIGNLHTSSASQGNVLQRIQNNGRQITGADTLTFTRDGTYLIEAVVLNGSETYSKEARTIVFTIDKSAPTGMTVVAEQGDSKIGYTNYDYENGAWAKNVRLTVSGATDDNMSVYEYSTDNGKKWYKLDDWSVSDKYLYIPTPAGQIAPGRENETEENKTIKSGSYTVQVRAKDLSGNTSVPWVGTVKVDNTTPRAGAPELTATSVSTKEFDAYVVSVVTETGGTVIGQSNGSALEASSTNPIFTVDSGKDLLLTITPSKGYKFKTMTMDGGDPVDTIEQANGIRTYKFNSVTGDHAVKVSFESDGTQPANPSDIGTDGAQQAAAITAQYLAGEVTTVPNATVEYDSSVMSVSTPVTVTVSTGGTGTGKVKLVGVDNTNPNHQAEQNSPVTIYAKAAAGSKLSGITVNGEPVTLSDVTVQNGAGDGYDGYSYTTFAATADTEIQVNFTLLDKQKYAVTLNTNESEGKGQVTLVGVDSNHLAEEGSTVTVYAKPDTFYRLTSVSLKSGDGEYVAQTLTNVGSGDYAGWKQMTFTVSGNTSIKAVFTGENTRELELEETDPEQGTVQFVPNTEVMTINGNQATALVGSEIQLKIDLEDGYRVSSVTYGGTSIDSDKLSDEPKITVPAGEGKLKIKVAFTVDDTAATPIDVRVNIVGNGSVVPGTSSDGSGANAVFQVISGQQKTIVFKPAPHYEIGEIRLTSKTII